jgi:hypothetical protein
LIGPHAWERCEVRAAEKLVRVFCFPIPVCFAEDIKGGFVSTHDFSSSKSIGSISTERREWEGVAAVEKMSEKASKFAIGTYCDGDERIIAVNDLPDKFIS